VVRGVVPTFTAAVRVTAVPDATVVTAPLLLVTVRVVAVAGFV
jgi:hypothetical protein